MRITLPGLSRHLLGIYWWAILWLEPSALLQHKTNSGQICQAILYMPEYIDDVCIIMVWPYDIFDCQARPRSVDTYLLTANIMMLSSSFQVLLSALRMIPAMRSISKMPRLNSLYVSMVVVCLSLHFHVLDLVFMHHAKTWTSLTLNTTSSKDFVNSRWNVCPSHMLW